MPGFLTDPIANATNVTITPTGDVAAMNVQDAVAELSTEKATKDSPIFTGGAGIGVTGTGETSLSLGRANSASEGGQLNFSRAVDNAQAWYLDVFGNTTTPAFRLINTTGTGTVAVMSVDTNGLIAGGGTSLGAWTSYTPTITSATGTFTTVSGTARYCKIGRTVTATGTITITTNGTAAGTVFVTLPFTAGSASYIGAGRENASTGNMLQVNINPNTSYANINTYNNGYPGANGYSILWTVTYESST